MLLPWITGLRVASFGHAALSTISRFQRPILLILLLSIANLAVDVVLVGVTTDAAALRPPPLSGYSLIDEDYPPRLPLPHARSSVLLSLEESVRYDPTHTESPFEWTYTSPSGDGNVHLGPNHRFFNPTLSYELHCLRVVVTALRKERLPPPGDRERAHIARCLNVLRQFTLCAADATLEPAHSLDAGRNHTLERVVGERRCVDWPALYETIEQNGIEWRDYQATLAR